MNIINSRLIIGVCGFIGSGKDTLSKILIEEHGFYQDSFAGNLKDVLSSLFGWDRRMLEGSTPESRIWRNQVDPWWAKRLNIPHLTPRWVMQHIGTNLMRDNFHQDIWTAGLEKRLYESNHSIVISDCRFPNEIEALRRLGSKIIWIKRGPLPNWYNLALEENKPDANHDQLREQNRTMSQLYPWVHFSEWAWIGQQFDYEIENNGSLNDLRHKIKNLVQ